MSELNKEDNDPYNYNHFNMVFEKAGEARNHHKYHNESTNIYIKSREIFNDILYKTDDSNTINLVYDILKIINDENLEDISTLTECVSGIINKD